jgi:6-phosphogluconolactonase
MAKASPAADKRINRRIVLKAGAALAAAGPALLRGGHAEAQPRANRATALFAYVGAFTTPERKGHGGGINVYRVDPASGAWTHEQLLEIVNPSFLTLDRAQRFLYSVHADLEEVSAYAIDNQNGRITALNRQSCGGKNRCTCRSIRPAAGLSPPITALTRLAGADREGRNVGAAH